MKRLLAVLVVVVAAVVVLSRLSSEPHQKGAPVANAGAAPSARAAPSLASPRLAMLPSDETARADAVDRAAVTPTADTVALLREVIANDPSPLVRERAVIAYVDALGKEAVPVLRELATDEEQDDSIVAVAAASLHRVRNQFPDPARTHIEVDMPANFLPDAPVELVIRCIVDDYVRKAFFAVKLSPEIEVIDGDLAPWRGSLAGGQILERRVRVRIRAAGEIRARFTADFPDVFDAETVQLRIAAGAGTLSSSTQIART